MAPTKEGASICIDTITFSATATNGMDAATGAIGPSAPATITVAAAIAANASWSTATFVSWS